MAFRDIFGGSRLARIERTLEELGRKIDRIEYFSHGSRATYVGDNRVLVKSVVAGSNIAYLVEADDKLLSPWFIVTGDYETDVKQFVLDTVRPDSHCIDVGANFGFFAGVMARFAPQGRVIGIEPDPRVHALLQDNMWINGFHHAQAINAAAAEQPGEITLYRRSSRAANTSIIPMSDAFTAALGEKPVEPFTVPGVTIDGVAAELGGRVDLMKIDVEGAEPLVFRGARRTIADNPGIVIVMEWSPDQIRGGAIGVDTFLDELQAQGLAAFGIEGQTLAPIPYATLLTLPYRSAIVLKRP